MVYELAQWFLAKAKGLWGAFWRRGFVGKLFSLPVVLPLTVICLALGLFLYVASFVRILENIGRRLFFFFKRGFSNAGFIGKVVYLPFLLLSVLFCVAIMVLSIGQALPFSARR